MFRKFYDRIKDFTYADILIINVFFMFFSLIAWLIYLCTDDLSIYDMEGGVNMLVNNLLETIYIHLAVWLSSAATGSFVLWLFKRKKRTDSDDEMEQKKD